MCMFCFSDAAYKMMGFGFLCSDKTYELNEQECRQAGESLGLPWGGTWTGKDQFPACLYVGDETHAVYFNLSPKPRRTNVNPKWAAICKEGA